MKYIPKEPLWLDIPDGITTVTALHSYTIRWDDNEHSYHVNYVQHKDQETGFTYKSSIDEAVDWVVNTHMPSKLKEWFLEIK